MTFRFWKLRFLPVLFLFIVFSGAFFACRARSADNGQTAAQWTTFTDSTGRQVEIPAKISRISASGSLAQMFLIAVAPDMLCTIAEDFPQSQAEYMPDYVRQLPVIGKLYGAADLNLEELAAIAPEIVIDAGDLREGIGQDMDSISKAVFIPAVHITASLESTPAAFRTLGKLLGRESKGEELAAFCEKTTALAQQVMEQVGGNKKSVLFCMGRQGLNVLAAGTFHTEVLDWLTDNRAVLANPVSRSSGNEVNMEQLLLWDPEVILFDNGSVYADAGSDKVWRQMSAIRRGSYVEVPLGPYNWMRNPPSINRYLGMLWLLKILYPEYAQFDLYAETAEYYRLFYGYELTKEQFNRLTANSGSF
jgi:iron complex transport system substrate-binding protein